MSDLISRETAIDAHCELCPDKYICCPVRNGNICPEFEVFRLLPSAQPETHDKRTETHACDLINREQAIDAVKDLPNCRNGFSDTYDKACIIGVLEDLPTAQPHWIPCSERLPEDSNFYIVTHKDFSVGFIWYSVFHGWEWQENPVAWMPLPEPYGGESDV